MDPYLNKNYIECTYNEICKGMSEYEVFVRKSLRGQICLKY